MLKAQLFNTYNSSVKTPYDIFDEVEQYNGVGVEQGRCELRYLWRAVIAQALIDALNNSKKLSNRIERARAIAWFSPKNKDFLVVCSNADLDPNYVLEKARKALKARENAICGK